MKDFLKGDVGLIVEFQSPFCFLKIKIFVFILSSKEYLNVQFKLLVLMLEFMTFAKNYFVIFTTKKVTIVLFLASSVTRFGEISPLWQNFNSIWEIFGMVLIWYLANFCTCFGSFMLLLCFMGKFSLTHTTKDLIIIWPCGHTASSVIRTESKAGSMQISHMIKGHIFVQVFQERVEVTDQSLLMVDHIPLKLEAFAATCQHKI